MSVGLQAPWTPYFQESSQLSHLSPQQGCGYYSLALASSLEPFQTLLALRLILKLGPSELGPRVLLSDGCTPVSVSSGWTSCFWSQSRDSTGSWEPLGLPLAKPQGPGGGLCVEELGLERWDAVMGPLAGLGQERGRAQGQMW